MRRTVPPSSEIEEQIDRLLAVGVGENPRESLSELAKLGARLIIQRAVEDEFDAWLGRARYERRPGVESGGCATAFALAGCRRWRGSSRSRSRRSARPPSRSSPSCFRAARRSCARSRCGDGDRRVRARAVDARHRVAVRAGGLGKLSKTTASRVCQELRERFEQFKRRDLYDVGLAALFLDAVFLSVRPSGPKEGVLVAWGFTEQGERVLLSVMLGMRESHRGLARARTRPDHPRARRAAAHRRRRRPRTDRGDRAMLARL